MRRQIPTRHDLEGKLDWREIPLAFATLFRCNLCLAGRRLSLPWMTTADPSHPIFFPRGDHPARRNMSVPRAHSAFAPTTRSVRIIRVSPF